MLNLLVFVAMIELVDGLKAVPVIPLAVGAGAGTFARPVAAGGASVICMEPDDGLREELARSGLDVTATLADIEESSVDYAYTLNVLEHIRDASETIAELYRCLKPGGRLLVYVPAFQCLYSQMDAHVGHFRRYRRKPLVQLLESAGFDVISARYVDSLGKKLAIVAAKNDSEMSVDKQ